MTLQSGARTLFQLLLLESGDVLRLEAQEGVDFSRLLRVIMLGDGELMKINQRNDLEWHSANRSNAARDVVEMEVLRRRKQLMRWHHKLR